MGWATSGLRLFFLLQNRWKKNKDMTGGVWMSLALKGWRGMGDLGPLDLGLIRRVWLLPLYTSLALYKYVAKAYKDHCGLPGAATAGEKWWRGCRGRGVPFPQERRQTEHRGDGSVNVRVAFELLFNGGLGSFSSSWLRRQPLASSSSSTSPLPLLLLFFLLYFSSSSSPPLPPPLFFLLSSVLFLPSLATSLWGWVGGVGFEGKRVEWVLGSQGGPHIAKWAECGVLEEMKNGRGVKLSSDQCHVHRWGEGWGQGLDVGGSGCAVHWPGSQWSDMEMRGEVSDLTFSVFTSSFFFPRLATWACACELINWLCTSVWVF